MDLRYGENPHQSAALYGRARPGIAGAEQLHGKELSYNNLVDLDAAWQLVCEFAAPAAAIIKHTNPCGCAEQDTLAEAYRKAFEVRPGLGLRRRDRLQSRGGRGDRARRSPRRSSRPSPRPDYTPEALAILTAKKNLRLHARGARRSTRWW